MANRVNITTVTTAGNKTVATIFDDDNTFSGVINFKGLSEADATALITNPETVVAAVLKYGDKKAIEVLHFASGEGVGQFAQVDMDFNVIDWTALEETE